LKVNDIQHIGVLGAGLMGHAIAQVFASAGYRINIYDADIAMIEKAKERIAANFDVFIQLKLASSEERERCLELVTVSSEDIDKVVKYVHGTPGFGKANETKG
jgi:3-hydroxybutyryl-CoA dehydrogenase